MQGTALPNICAEDNQNKLYFSSLAPVSCYMKENFFRVQFLLVDRDSGQSCLTLKYFFELYDNSCSIRIINHLFIARTYLTSARGLAAVVPNSCALLLTRVGGP